MATQSKRVAKQNRRTKRPTKTPSRKGSTIRELLAERGIELKDDDPGFDEKIAEALGAGVKPTTDKPDAPGLTPEDEAALTSLQGVSGRRSPILVEYLKACREGHIPNDEIRFGLHREALDFEHVADRLRPEPATRDTMLVDALEVIDRALVIFEHEGSSTDTALGIALEGLRCAASDFDLFMDASSAPCKVDSMAYLRASERAKLALSLAQFRAKHAEWKPTKADEAEGDEQAKVSA